MNQYREMRLFVIFDLPTQTKEERKIYSEFRDHLIKDGFIMIQYSVYARFCRNDTEYLKILRRIKNYVPRKTGNIRVFKVTEKQYQNMVTFSGEFKSDEKLLSVNPLVVIE